MGAKLTILSNPEDTWDAYCAETHEDGRSPQGAMAFAIDRLHEVLPEINRLNEVIAAHIDHANKLHGQLERADHLLRMMLTDPEPTLDEPDTDGEVIFKFRRMVCDHLGLPYGSDALTDDQGEK